MNIQKLAAVTVVAVASMFLASCSTPPADFDPGPTSDSGPPPGFSGPFADEYRQAWTEANSAFVAGVLEDEQISEQEWAEVTSRLSDCLAESGIKFQGFDPQGGYSAQVGDMDGDRANELMGTCEKESGEAWIGWLRSMAVTNPENRDVNEIMAECLVREGAVAAGYSSSDYQQDVPNMTFPYLDPQAGPAIFAACNNDPLSLLPDE